MHVTTDFATVNNANDVLTSRASKKGAMGHRRWH